MKTYWRTKAGTVMKDEGPSDDEKSFDRKVVCVRAAKIESEESFLWHLGFRSDSFSLFNGNIKFYPHYMPTCEELKK